MNCNCLGGGVIFFYIMYIISSCPGWILVVVTLERLMKMAIPYRAALLYTRRNCIILLVGLLICISLFYIPILMFEFSHYVIISHKYNSKLLYVAAGCWDNAPSTIYVHLFMLKYRILSFRPCLYTV